VPNPRDARAAMRQYSDRFVDERLEAYQPIEDVLDGARDPVGVLGARNEQRVSREDPSVQRNDR